MATAGEELDAGGPGCSEVDERPGSRAEAGLRHLEEKITYAVANLDYPRQWKNTDSRPTEEGNETGSELRSCKVSFARGGSVPGRACY